MSSPFFAIDESEVDNSPDAVEKMTAAA